jgi:hypothetical protein
VAGRGTVLPLAELSPAEVAELMGGILAADPGAALAADVHRRTGGNPFFVHQVTHLLLAQAGPSAPAAPTAAAGIPFGVRETIRRRLARLDAATNRLLAVAAVVGPEFPAALLAEVAGQPVTGVQALLEEAARARVLTRTGPPPAPWRFAHDLFRETVYETLEAGDRSRLHLEAGRALERERAAGGEVAPAELAAHFVHAAAAGAERAVHWSVLAAEDATRRLAHEEAARHWGRALEGLDGSATTADAGTRAGMLLGLADSRRRGGAVAAAGRDCRRAADLARRTGDARLLAAAALGLHAIGVEAGAPPDELLALLDEAATALGPGDGALRARVLAATARELAWAGLEHDRAVSLVEQAVASARHSGDAAVLGSCLLARHNVMWGPGNAGERLALAAEIAALAQRTGDRELEAQVLRVADLLELGDPAFHAELAAFVAAAAGLRQPQVRYAALARRAMQALLTGRFAEAERLIEETAALGREIGEPDADNVRDAQLWELRSAQGRRVELVAEMLPRVRERDPQPESLWRQAVALLEQGDRASALAVVGPLLESDLAAIPRDRGWLPAVALGGELAAGLGARPDQLKEHYRLLAPHAGGTLTIGVAIACAGAIDHYLGCWPPPSAAPPRRAATWSGRWRPTSAWARPRGRSAAATGWPASCWTWTSRRRGPPPCSPRSPRQPPGWACRSWRGRPPNALGRPGPRRPPAGCSAVPAAPGSSATAAPPSPSRTPKACATSPCCCASPASRSTPATCSPRPALATPAAPPCGWLGADEVLDDRARRELRARLAELGEEIDQAERWADLERAARATAERDALMQELAAATGLGGRGRLLGDQSERARKAVTARIRDAIARIERVHPELGANLRASVTTGTWCAYTPAGPATWEL